MNIEEKVLIVDDDESYRLVAERFVSSAGYQYISVEDGGKAIDTLKMGDISVMVTDMVMPGMNGMELLKRAKELQPDIDVIMMTGYSKLCSFIDVINGGATDFLSKPFTVDEFTAKLDRVFRERRLREELKESKQKARVDKKAKTALLASSTNELRTLTEGVLGFSALRGKADLTPEEMKYINMVIQSAGRLLKLNDHVLGSSAKIETGEDAI